MFTKYCEIIIYLSRELGLKLNSYFNLQMKMRDLWLIFLEFNYVKFHCPFYLHCWSQTTSS